MQRKELHMKYPSVNWNGFDKAQMNKIACISQRNVIECLGISDMIRHILKQYKGEIRETRK